MRDGYKVIVVPKQNLDEQGFLISVDHTGTERVQTNVRVPDDVLILACDHVITLFDLLYLASGEGERGLPRLFDLTSNWNFHVPST